MEKLIETLAEKLKLKNEEVLKALNIPNNYTFKDLVKALGVHAIFSTAEDYEKVLAHRLSKKDEEIRQIIESTKKIETDFNNAKLENERIKNYEKQIKDLVKSEWNSLGIKRPFEKGDLNIENLDFSNLQKSILNYASNEGFEITNNTAPEAEIEKTTNTGNYLSPGTFRKY